MREPCSWWGCNKWRFYNGLAGCTIRMKASVSFPPSDRSLPSLGEQVLTLVGVQPNLSSLSACAPAPNTAAERALPFLMTSSI